MHRISLRGPWDLAIFDDRIEASRKFHTPPGLMGRLARVVETDGGSPQVQLLFRWQSAIEWPVESLLLNDGPIPLEGSAEQNSPPGTIFRFDSHAGVGTVDLVGILLPFNVVTLVWSQWPIEWRPISGRYTPNPQHPLHFDSWLDIDE